jgi:glycosyltransferase involved in cell wall biosynthesis
LARGHEVHGVTPRFGYLQGLKEYVPADRRFGDGWMSPFNEAARILDHYRLARDCPGDLIHVHYAASMGAWLSIIAGRREPMIVSIMGGDVLDDEQMTLPATARWMTSQVLKRADCVSAKTHYMLKVLKGRGIPKSELMKVLWGVDSDFFHVVPAEAMRNELGLHPSHRIILSPRILRPFYNIHRIVDAMPGVLKRVPDARLLLTEMSAEPAYRDELRKQARELGIENEIVWAGIVPHERMPELFSLADVTVGVPPSDGFPQSVLEAMACGVPCVVSRLKRYEEILQDGENALFVDPKPASITGAILDILEDETLAGRLGERGLETVRQKADLASDIERMDNAIRRLVSEPSKGPAPLWVRAACLAILAGFTLRNGFRSLGGFQS